jgi:hypothetical protein
MGKKIVYFDKNTILISLYAITNFYWLRSKFAMDLHFPAFVLKYVIVHNKYEASYENLSKKYCSSF